MSIVFDELCRFRNQTLEREGRVKIISFLVKLVLFLRGLLRLLIKTYTRLLIW